MESTTHMISEKMKMKKCMEQKSIKVMNFFSDSSFYCAISSFYFFYFNFHSYSCAIGVAHVGTETGALERERARKKSVKSVRIIFARAFFAMASCGSLHHHHKIPFSLKAHFLMHNSSTSVGTSEKSPTTFQSSIHRFCFAFGCKRLAATGQDEGLRV